ncbi:MAG: Gfo/Idh/MocA family oxidoreductase [Lachnospiraceae bacterium]|nr:Gfo/Idh/MocA family oxidoreductase [Lachnospiraceae bacterium]
MKKVITYGTYDLLHYGHIALLKRAKALGDYLIVGVTSDQFDRGRGKLNVQQSVAERIAAVQALGIADKIIVEEYEGQKIDDIQKYDVDVFTVGSDWVGKFDYLREYCEVTYLSRTEGISSTQLRTEKNDEISLGIYGATERTVRFLKESRFVSGLFVKGAYSPNTRAAEIFCEQSDIEKYASYEAMLADTDAVYIFDTIDRHFDLVMQALEAGCHVICETPLFLSEEQTEAAYALADSKGLVLFEAVKTLWYPAFQHLLLLINSGVAGTVKSVDVACSQIPDDPDFLSNPYEGSLYDWGTIALLPIIKILGTKYQDVQMYDYSRDNFSYLSQGMLRYDSAIGTWKAGRGIKSEGELIVTGTKGYIYVPAPWWKTEYFELRHEDLRATEKYFFKSEGAGMRYEILEFVRMINNGNLTHYHYTREEMRTIAGLIEKFDKREVISF